MLQYIQKSYRVGGGTNSYFLSLIPKEVNPSYFSQLQHISLCNASYKILAKVIVNRLKNVLSKVILDNQGGFMQKRQIMDNIILVQEAIHSSQANKEKGMIGKIDMENAFDRVRHSFFFMSCINLVFLFFYLVDLYCICNPWISPLVNGRPTDFFKGSRGCVKTTPFLLFSISSWLNP
jgi:hypothetical protein